MGITESISCVSTKKSRRHSRAKKKKEDGGNEIMSSSRNYVYIHSIYGNQN